MWAPARRPSTGCTKGLERTAVILADMSREPDKTILYIGASRAVPCCDW